MDKHNLTILAREFRAGEGSFLLQLRIEMYWDKNAFRRLTEAMRVCCKDYQYSPEHQERFRKEQEQLTEEQMADEHLADEYYSQSQRERYHASTMAGRGILVSRSLGARSYLSPCLGTNHCPRA